jgi:hypothetical protein
MLVIIHRYSHLIEWEVKDGKGSTVDGSLLPVMQIDMMKLCSNATHLSIEAVQTSSSHKHTLSTTNNKQTTKHNKQHNNNPPKNWYTAIKSRERHHGTNKCITSSSIFIIITSFSFLMQPVLLFKSTH